MDKLQELAESMGYDSHTQMFEDLPVMMDVTVPAICMNEGCDYTTVMEPDQTAGHCPICKTDTVKSCLILAGVIKEV